MEPILEYLFTLSAGILYLVLGLSAFMENIFPPLPGDTITAFGAFLAGTGRLDFVPVYFSTTIGSLIGFLSIFYLGRYLGRNFFMENNFPFFKAESIKKAERWFRRYGYFIIALNRFLPGIRSVIALAGGISRLHPMASALLALLSCAIWNFAWISMGYVLGNNWEIVKLKLSSILMKYNLSIILLFSVLLIFYILKRYFQDKR
jgi:membrane protein DedA with SNARE-associated domain